MKAEDKAEDCELAAYYLMGLQTLVQAVITYVLKLYGTQSMYVQKAPKLQTI